jgi:isocitrate dehydrogenase kinase/phosphatase
VVPRRRARRLPREFQHFPGPAGELRDYFRQVHGDLFEVGFSLELQRRQREGEVVDFAPYRQDLRLPR